MGTTTTVYIRPDSPTNDPDDGHRGGQWTSFNEGDQSAGFFTNASTGYIWQGNPTVLKVGDNTWIASDLKATTSLYTQAKQRHIDQGHLTVILPVVSSSVDLFNTHANKPIVGFIPFKITGVSNGSGEAAAGGGGGGAAGGGGGGAAGGGGGGGVEKCYTYLYIKGNFLPGSNFVIPGDGGSTPGGGTTPGGSGGNPSNGLFSGVPKLVK
jgi:hypothetical protein